MPPKFRMLLAIIFSALMLDASPCALAASADQPTDALTITVEGDDWGSANRQDIEALLYSVAHALLPATAGQPARTVVVTHTDGAPEVLYDRGAKGEYRVLLHARDTNWHLYVYEFAHEFCHIVANYDRHALGAIRRNQWFEEALCETASLFALNRLADEWQASPPPVPALADGGRQLRWFYDLLIGEPHRRIAKADFNAWLHARVDTLRGDPYQRRLDDVVAMQLLPLFQKDASKWDALRYLNLDPTDNDCSLDTYLGHWYGNARNDDKLFVAAVLAALGAEARPLVAAGADYPRAR